MKICYHRRTGFTLFEAFVVLVILVILALLLIPVFSRPGGGSPRSGCQSNLKQIGLGFQQYLQDYDERFPIAISGNYPQASNQNNPNFFGWADALQPYLKSIQIFQCPSERTEPGTSPTQPQYTDYWYNARLSGVRQNKLDSDSHTIINGDGNDKTDVTDARYHLMGIPDEWRHDTASPLYRHLDGCNFAFADGHVKWLSANAWQSATDAKTNPQFTFHLKPPQQSLRRPNSGKILRNS